MQLTYLCSAFSSNSYIKDGFLNLIYTLGYYPFAEERVTDVPTEAYNMGFTSHHFLTVAAIPIAGILALALSFLCVNIIMALSSSTPAGATGEARAQLRNKYKI